MRESGTDMGARWREVTDRIPPAVLLAGGVVLVLLLFGGLAWAILRAESALDDLGAHGPGDVPAASGDAATQDDDPGATDLGRDLAMDGSPAGATSSGARGDRPGIAADASHAGDGASGDRGAGATASPATDAGAAASTGDGDASPAPGTTTPTTGSSEPGTTQPPTTAPPTTESSDGDAVGGLLQLLGLGVSLTLG